MQGEVLLCDFLRPSAQSQDASMLQLYVYDNLQNSFRDGSVAIACLA